MRRPSYIDPNIELNDRWACANYRTVMADGGDEVERTLHSVGGKETLPLPRQRDQVTEFMKVLSLAHMCDVEHIGGGKLFYNGPSPDEVALVEFAQTQNFECTKSTEEVLGLTGTGGIPIELAGDDAAPELEFEVFRKMDFNSDRKRMSVLLRDPSDGKIRLLIKGADSIIKARLDSSQYPKDMSEMVEWFLDTASRQGLRTLLMGMKVVEEGEKDQFLADCAAAEKDLANREANLEKVYDAFERNICLIGSTAVEDRLQDEVPQTIHSLQKAGIKIWMLTGDKLETAENIGESCKMIKRGMDLTRLSCLEDVMAFCTEEQVLLNNQRIADGKDKGLLVEATALAIIMDEPMFKGYFLRIAKTCEAVICCRVSPG